MATAKKTTDVPAEAEEQTVNAEAAAAKENINGTTEESDQISTSEEEVSTSKATKAGRRSAKGLAEAEAKAEKIEHQQHRTEEEAAEAEKP